MRRIIIRNPYIDFGYFLVDLQEVVDSLMRTLEVLICRTIYLAVLNL